MSSGLLRLAQQLERYQSRKLEDTWSNQPLTSTESNTDPDLETSTEKSEHNEHVSAQIDDETHSHQTKSIRGIRHNTQISIPTRSCSWRLFEIPPYESKVSIPSLPVSSHNGFLCIEFSPYLDGLTVPDRQILLTLNKQDNGLEIFRHNLPFFFPVDLLSHKFLNSSLETFCSEICNIFDRDPEFRAQETKSVQKVESIFS